MTFTTNILSVRCSWVKLVEISNLALYQFGSFLDVKALSDDMDKAEAEASTTGQFLQRSYSAQNCAKFLTSGSYSQNVHTLHLAAPLAELFLL
jgi:hypothetical protein